MHDLAERELTSADNASVLVQEQILALLTALPDWELNCVEGIHRIERVYPLPTSPVPWRSPTGSALWQRNRIITRRCCSSGGGSPPVGGVTRWAGCI